MPTIRQAVDAIAHHIGFPAARCRTVARQLTNGGLLPMGGPRKSPEIEQEHFVSLIIALGADRGLRTVADTVAEFAELTPCGTPLAALPESLCDTAADWLAIYVEMAVAGSPDAKADVRAMRFEFAHNWAEFSIHDAGEAKRFRQPGSLSTHWEASYRTSTVISGAGLADAATELFGKKIIMANIFKKSEFVMPTLADASPAYAELIAKQAAITAEQSALLTDKRQIEKQIAADTSREVRPAIAELLGDAPSGKAMLRKRLAEIVERLRDIDAALAVIRQRLVDALGAASTAVCRQVKPEYARRVAAMAKAMQALDEAHREYAEMCDDFFQNDVSFGSLVPMMPNWLGAANEPDRRIARWMKEAREAGYVS